MSSVQSLDAFGRADADGPGGPEGGGFVAGFVGIKGDVPRVDAHQPGQNRRVGPFPALPKVTTLATPASRRTGPVQLLPQHHRVKLALDDHQRQAGSISWKPGKSRGRSRNASMYLGLCPPAGGSSPARMSRRRTRGWSRPTTRMQRSWSRVGIHAEATTPETCLPDRLGAQPPFVQVLPGLRSRGRPEPLLALLDQPQRIGPGQAGRLIVARLERTSGNPRGGLRADSGYAFRMTMQGRDAGQVGGDPHGFREADIVNAFDQVDGVAADRARPAPPGLPLDVHLEAGVPVIMERAGPEAAASPVARPAVPAPRSPPGPGRPGS